jgi:hypothetical protein
MSNHPRIADKVLSVPVGVTASCLMLAIFLGCMSLEIGNRTVHTPPCEEGVLLQQGETHIPANTSQFIRYPIPYPRKPNIEIDSLFDDCVIAEEHEDGFLLRNPTCGSSTVKWKARGIKCDPPSATPSAPPPLPAPETPPATPSAPPPLPVPATTPTLPAPTPERHT